MIADATGIPTPDSLISVPIERRGRSTSSTTTLSACSIAPLSFFSGRDFPRFLVFQAKIVSKCDREQSPFKMLRPATSNQKSLSTSYVWQSTLASAALSIGTNGISGTAAFYPSVIQSAWSLSIYVERRQSAFQYLQSLPFEVERDKCWKVNLSGENRTLAARFDLQFRVASRLRGFGDRYPFRFVFSPRATSTMLHDFP